MKISDIKRLFLGLNRDDSPAFLKDGEYVDGLNIRTVSSEDEQESGQAETLRGEVEILIDVNADITYYGSAIGGEFQYSGYEEVTIGSQVWMKNNWDANYPGSKVYDNLEANRAIYGGLYTWDQVMAEDFVPDGWRVPTEADVDELLIYLGGALIAGGKMKEPDTDHWLTPNTGADDSSGFKGLGGGQYDSAFTLLQEYGKFWIDAEDVIVDYDGNVYTSVIIGTQEWMIENLRTLHYADGTPIPNVILNADWTAENGTPGHDGAYCWYNNDIANREDYGALYNWYAVDNAHGLAPTGWRIPTQTDWETLSSFLGGILVAGGKLKEIGTDHWQLPNTGATDQYGFKAVGNGDRFYDGGFNYLMTIGYIWGATSLGASSAYCVRPDNAGILLNPSTGTKRNGMGIRCMRDV